MRNTGANHGERRVADGCSLDRAAQDQIDASMENAISLARSRLPIGDSLTLCEECEITIPGARRKAVPDVRLCVRCQTALDKQQANLSSYNRRGSKDSQLR